jgi:hypothetical protein
LSKKVDELSKEPLSFPVGAFGLNEFIEGEDIESIEFLL